MPLQQTDLVLKTGSQTEWEVLPEDVYQCVLDDIGSGDFPKYQSTSGEMVSKLLFKFRVLDEGKQQGLGVTGFATQSWFAGKSGISPSKLIGIVKAFSGFYSPDTDVATMETPDINYLNNLIGKQVRLNVKLNADGTRNVITDYTAIKKELPVPEEPTIGEDNPPF